MAELPFVPYNTSLAEYAKQNRKNPTKAEWLLWNVVLKGKKFLGYKFRRQKVIGAFILDFYCSKLLFWIEIDWGYHTSLEQEKYDQLRDETIRHYGIQIIRFTNEEIETNLKGVTTELENYLNEREKQIQSFAKQNHHFQE
jgi:very-short-patch-repair endonuclease